MASSIPTTPTFILDPLLEKMKIETLFAAVKFKIPDTVHELEPNADLHTISSKLELPPSTLSRLLNACVTLGILDINTHDKQDFYTTTPMAKYWLLSSSERSLGPIINLDSYLDQQFRSKLSHAVELGENRLQDAPDIFQEITVNPEAAEKFTEGMASLCQSATSLINAFNLSKCKSAIDVAGGVGVFAGELKKAYRDMNVSILELPVTISQAKVYWAKRGGQPDFNFIPGDMFKGPLPEADLYILGHVLHDHPDEACTQILSNIAESVKSGGAVLLLEKVLPDPPTPGKWGAHMHDMYMMCAPVIAKERTLKEYRYLLQKAGFGDVQFKENVDNHFYDAILAIKS